MPFINSGTDYTDWYVSYLYFTIRTLQSVSPCLKNQQRFTRQSTFLPQYVFLLFKPTYTMVCLCGLASQSTSRCM